MEHNYSSKVKEGLPREEDPFYQAGGEAFRRLSHRKIDVTTKNTETEKLEAIRDGVLNAFELHSCSVPGGITAELSVSLKLSDGSYVEQNYVVDGGDIREETKEDEKEISNKNDREYIFKISLFYIIISNDVIYFMFTGGARFSRTAICDILTENGEVTFINPRRGGFIS